MGNFIGKDPRGFVVVLSESAWVHSEPHHDEIAGGFLRSAETIVRPELILDNPRVDGTRRVADERYIRYDGVLGTHIIVPTIILTTERHFAGYGTVGPGARVSATIYTSSNIPAGSVVWRKV